MNAQEIGEFGFIDLIRKRFPGHRKAVIRGIGDDAAVFRSSPGCVSLVTTDLLIEGVHFLRRHISMEDLGYKALAVNLSDIAAMGGCCKYAVIALAFPPDENVDSLLECYEGMVNLANRHDVELVGGDTSINYHGLNITITVFGEADADAIIYRDGAKIGDSIFLTGFLGDSSYGLGIMLGKWDTDSQYREYFYRAHNLPVPYLREGQFLARSGFAHSMIDISDGLSSDLNHICLQSNSGARIYEDAIPFSPELSDITADDHRRRLNCALHGGEDYCLLVTGHPDLQDLYKEETGETLYRIGEIVDEPGIAFITRDGTSIPLRSQGHDHFRTDPEKGPR